jgi:hypothetical protein
MATAPAETVAETTEVATTPPTMDAADFYREDGGDGAEAATEQTEEQETQPEPIKRPASWDNAQDGHWNALPRETQEYVSQRESERERFLHGKAQEAAQVRQQIASQSRDEMARWQQERANEMAQHLSQMAQLAQLPPEPDQRLLTSDNPDDHRLYMVQKNRYEAISGQVAQLHRSAEEARQRAEGLQSQARSQAIQADDAKLLEKWPHWAEPSKRDEHKAKLVSVAKELGFDDQMLLQTDSFDLFALDKIRGWQEDAGKYRGLMQQKMEPVRAAKATPPAMAPGAASTGRRQPTDVAAMLYPDDKPRLQR